MKKLILVLSLMGVQYVLVAQSSDQQLNKRLNDYLQSTRDLDIEKVLDYTHPSFFKFVSRLETILDFSRFFMDEEIETSFDSIEWKKVSAPFVWKGVSYRQVDYHMDLSIQLSSKVDWKSEPGEIFIAILIDALKQAFPNGQISYNSGKQRFKISADKIMMALKDADTAPWYFLRVEKKDANIMTQLYPKEVIQHFKFL